MKLYLAFQDLKEYPINNIKLLQKYYNIPNHIYGDNLIWLIASNIHSGKMNMAPDKVWIKYNNKLVPLLPSNLIENESYKQLFLDADPDPKKKNLEWMVTSFISGGYNISELPQLKLAIIKFNKLREKGTFKDNLVDFGGLHGFIRNNKEFPALTDFLKKYLDIEESEYKFNVITDNSDVKIIQTLNEPASCKYGANTKWCTAGKQNNKFKEYYKNGELYIIIPKNPLHTGEKYQLYIPSYYIDKELQKPVIINDYDEEEAVDQEDENNDNIILMDENDDPIDINELINMYPYLKTNSLLKYTLLRLEGLKMVYEDYLKSNGNLIYDIKDGKYEFKDGTYWYLDGYLNKIEKSNGDKYWYKDGKLHREDGPAVEWTNGDKYWYKNGKLNREDGPAVEKIDGDKWWYKNGKLHREDGPAVEKTDGSTEWYLNGLSHRLDGPAVEWANGDKYWYKNGKLHRIDGPAVEATGNYKAWYQNGDLHREDGPAIEYIDGTKEWYQNGIRHRIGGPAIEKQNGTKEWWINGNRVK
jgi:hypothetical protein